MSSSRRGTEFIIPVVFDVTTEAETTEMGAAIMLSVILGDAKLITRPRYGRGNPQGRIESWHMQNHPAADGSDHEAAIVFFPVSPPLEGHTPEDMQQAIDSFLKTTKEWL